MTDKAVQGRSRHSRAGFWLEFLGSMNLAITLLVVLAIASVIGSVLVQNEPYQTYQIQFGPFWFEVFRVLGLYDVYSAGWFVIILSFLVLSTSVCIYRNGPRVVREMGRYRTHLQENSLRSMKNKREWTLTGEPEAVEAAVRSHLQNHGYRVREKGHGDHRLLAGMKGRLNRLGYLFAHVGVVVICIGGLVDSDLGLKLGELAGQVKVETRDIGASQVPAESRLEPRNSSFSGSITIPEGRSADLIFLPMRDGFLVQELPFRVEVENFRIERYATGEERSYESDLVIYDDDLDEPLRTTIAVNEPFTYRGHTIYQSSFADGGSKLSMEAIPLMNPRHQPTRLEGEVLKEYELDTPDGDTLTIEFDNYQSHNIQEILTDAGEVKRQNFGPRVEFTVRYPNGESRQYVNYKEPVEIEGREFLLSGMRENQAQELRYLHIPVGPDGDIDRFVALLNRLHDTNAVRNIARQAADAGVGQVSTADEETKRQLETTMVRLMDQFTTGGFDAVVDHVRQVVPEEEHERVMQVYLRLLQTVIFELYADVLEAEGKNLQNGVSEEDIDYLDDAVLAFSGIAHYGSPVFLKLEDVEEVAASGLEIAKSPGAPAVYTGSLMLVVGVFLMFYVSQRWLYSLVRREENGQVRVVFAGNSNRQPLDFAEEFAEVSRTLGLRLDAGSEGRRQSG